jgi:hypothetical protein
MAEESDNEPASKETHVRRATREVNDLFILWKRKPAICVLVVIILFAGGFIWFANKFELFKREKSSHGQNLNELPAEPLPHTNSTTSDHPTPAATAPTTSTSSTTVNVNQNSGTLIGTVGTMTLQQFYSGPEPTIELIPKDIHKELDEVFVSILNVDTAYGSPAWKKLPLCNVPNDSVVRDVEAKWTKILQSTSVHWEAFTNEVECMNLAFYGYHASAFAFEYSLQAMEIKSGRRAPPPFDNSEYLASRSFQNLSNLIFQAAVATGATDTNEPVIKQKAFLDRFPSSTNDTFYPAVGSSAMMVARQALHHAQEGFQVKLNK